MRGRKRLLNDIPEYSMATRDEEEIILVANGNSRATPKILRLDLRSVDEVFARVSFGKKGRLVVDARYGE